MDRTRNRLKRIVFVAVSAALIAAGCAGGPLSTREKAQA